MNFIFVLLVVLLSAIASYYLNKKHNDFKASLLIPLIVINGPFFISFASTGYIDGWAIIGHYFLSLVIILGCMLGILFSNLKN